MKSLPKVKSEKEVQAPEKTAESFKIEKNVPAPSQGPSEQISPSQQQTTSPVPEGLPKDSRPNTDSPELKGRKPFKNQETEISIARESLDKEFLLQGVLIPQSGVAMGRSIKSRVVAFQQKGNILIMLEATQGHSLNSDFPQKFVLASFPILKKEDEFITFDFNAGMSKLLTLEEWYAKDYDGPSYSKDKQHAALQLANSYIEEAKLTEKNQLVIRQISLMNSNETASDNAMIRVPIEVKYYLSPYRPTESYIPFESPRRFDHYGFFEVNPQLSQTGDTFNYASRFNPEKPIIFAISANTPPEYVKAVEDGVLYWNKAFGKDLVKVGKAPHHVRAPDIDHNIVQWVKWDNAGSAYADAQMDPRTGEILHAQIYLTSAFAFGGKNKAREVLRKLNQNTAESSVQALRPGLKGLTQEHWCNLEYKTSLARVLEKIISSDMEDSVILKISQDYVREVVAHEVGHTLGLRHNFAGTLAATYRATERDTLFNEYLKAGKTNTSVKYSSSVMDYHRLEESAMIGDLIANAPSSLDYDHKAIQKLYFESNHSDSNETLFCTDSHADNIGFMDCQRFDFGPSAIEFAQWKIQTSLGELPQSLIERYIRNKTESPSKTPYATSQVPLEDTTKLSETMLQPLGDVLKLLTKDRALLSIERSFNLVDERNEPEVQAAYDNYLEKEFERLGGLSRVVNLVPQNYSIVASLKVEDVLNKPWYQSGRGQSGKPFSFTADELSQMRRDLKAYLKKLEASLSQTELKKLSSNGGLILRDHPLANDLARSLQKKAEDYVLQTTGEYLETTIYKLRGDSSKGDNSNTIENKDGKTYETLPVRLPVFKYPLSLRLIAGGLFGNERSEDLSWGVEEKASVKKALEELLDISLKTSRDEIDLTKQNRQVLRWMTENGKVLDQLR